MWIQNQSAHDIGSSREICKCQIYRFGVVFAVFFLFVDTASLFSFIYVSVQLTNVTLPSFITL